MAIWKSLDPSLVFSFVVFCRVIVIFVGVFQEMPPKQKKASAKKAKASEATGSSKNTDSGLAKAPFEEVCPLLTFEESKLAST